MCRRSWLVWNVGLLISGSACSIPAGSATVAGTVRDSLDRQVPDALVTVVSRDGSRSVGARTDRSGCFSVHALPCGQYDILVTKEGFESQRYPVAVKNLRELRIELRLARKSGARNTRPIGRPLAQP